MKCFSILFCVITLLVLLWYFYEYHSDVSYYLSEVQILSIVTIIVLWRRNMLLLLSITDAVSRYVKGKNKCQFAPVRWPSVSVIVPAYNESAVIESSVRSILENDYPSLNVIVVDDKSTDNTVELATRLEQEFENVQVVRKIKNGGKASAINSGVSATRDDFVVIVDADTVLRKDCVKNFVKTALKDPEIASVCGNVKVGNKKNLITLLQSFEYIVGLNLARRSQHLLRCITTVPGAACLWRTSAIRKIGGVPTDTLVEDTDLTLLALRNKLKLVYEPNAVGFTEAPCDLKGLISQRTRWLGGYIQAIEKHLPAFKSGGVLAWFGLPDLIYCNIFCFFMVPFAISSLVTNISVMPMLVFLKAAISYFFVEFVIAAIAYAEDRENLAELALVPVARTLWPLFLFCVFLRVIKIRLSRRKQAWSFVPRSGDLANNYKCKTQFN